MSNTTSTNRTPSLVNAEWSSEHAAEATEATLTAATISVARPQHNHNMSARASNARQTSLSFFYNDNEDEDFIINTHHTEEHFPRSQSQPNLMRTNLTKPTRGNLTRNPSAGSLVSIEVLQELMMERSTRSIGSYGSSGYKSSRASKCSNCSSSREGSARRRSISSEGDAQEDMDERGWRARVLQLKQLAIMEGLFDKRESLRWNPFSSITSGSRSNDAARDLLVETKPMPPRPKRRSLPGSLRSDDSDTECSDDRHLGPFGKCSQKAQRESEEPAFARQDGDNISNLSPQSDGLIYKQRKLEVSTHRRASDPPTSPTLSIRTTISNISHGDLVGDVHTFALKGTVGSDSSNNVCDVEKSPLTTGAELTKTQELLPMDEPQLLSPNRETKTHLPYSSGNEDRQQQQQSPKNAESAYLKNILLGLYNEQNTQNVDDENDEPADMTIVNDFAKAARRKSFQKSLSESFQSGDFDYQLSDALSSGAMSAEDDAHAVDLHQQEIDVDIEKKRSSQLYSRRESFESYKQRNSARMRRRPTVESETGKSAVSSLDSLASPIDCARAGNAALTSPPCHLTRSQFTNAAVAAMPPLKKENSIGSLSSLGTESIDRDGIKAEDYLRKHSNEHTASAKQSPQSKPNINGSRQEREERGGWVSGDQSSITMGTFFTQLQKTLTQGCQERENRSNVREVLDSSRRRSGASSITLGTFLNELKLVDKDSSSAEHDSDDDQDSGLNDMCDFDSGLASFLIAMRLGHFDCHDEVIGNTNTDEDDDRHLAAKAFMGLGFAAQLTGENESALDWYMKSLHLWESEIGAEHPSLACLHYTIGIVLSQERNDLEASVHFNNAIDLLKANETVDESTRASILFTEGMIFSVLGEAERAIECLKRGLLLCQNLDLNHATVMYEMGTLLAQQGELEHAINCYKHSLSIRERRIDNTFILMQTHYSLGVTLAEDDSPISKDYAMIHLQEALKLCGENHIQSPTIIHAIGVLSERRGDYHAASNWFYRELNAIKILFGEDDERFGMCSSDVGSSFYRIGKYDLANTLFEQALRILLHVTEDEQSLEVADLLYKIASCHESLCEYTEALGVFEEVKQLRLSHLGIESGLVIQTMLRIGNIQLARGETQLALNCFNEIVGIGYASDSINGIAIANAFYGKGCVQFCLFQLSDAMKSLNESLNWKLAALGEDNPDLACIFYQMAHVHLELSEKEDAILCFEEYSRLLKLDNHRNLQDNAEICYTAGIISKLKGQLDNALAFYNQALAMFQALFGNQQHHEKLASIHFDIGCIYASKGDNKEALRQLHLCLATRKQLLGSHVDVATVLFEMATILQKEGMTKPAIMCLEESNNIWQAKLSCSEKLVSVCHDNGKLWKSLLKYDEAEGSYEKALELAITIHGQNHSSVATILLDLGELLHEIGEYDQALFCYDESLGAFTQLFGPEDLQVATVFYCKGVALLFQSRFDEALDCLERSLVIRQEKLGVLDNDVADTLNTIGFLHLRKGNIDGETAFGPLTKALEIRRSLKNKAKVVSTLQNLASLYKKRKEFDMCLEIHSEILAVRQEEFGTNDRMVAEAWMNLGNIQTTAGRLVEATVSYEEALRIRTLITGYNDTSVAHVLFKLGLLSSRQNNYEHAKQLFEEYIRIRAEEGGESSPDQEMAQALTLLGDIQSDTGEKSKARINWLSAMEIYLSLGYSEEHPKVAKLKSRQTTVPAWFTHTRDISDWSSVVDAPLSLFNRLTSINSRSTASLAPSRNDIGAAAEAANDGT